MTDWFPAKDFPGYYWAIYEFVGFATPFGNNDVTYSMLDNCLFSIVNFVVQTQQ